jgi:hypothetical protein
LDRTSYCESPRRRPRRGKERSSCEQARYPEPADQRPEREGVAPGSRLDDRRGRRLDDLNDRIVVLTPGDPVPHRVAVAPGLREDHAVVEEIWLARRVALRPKDLCLSCPQVFDGDGWIGLGDQARAPDQGQGAVPRLSGVGSEGSRAELHAALLREGPRAERGRHDESESKNEERTSHRVPPWLIVLHRRTGCGSLRP